MIGHSTATRRPIVKLVTSIAGAIVGLMVLASSARPQGRELERYGAGSPEAKLMLYYSSTVAFSALGVMNTSSGPSRRFEGALELSYLPPLSAEQRTTGTDKPEATNLAPVFARPRVNARLPGAAMLELSWIPPVRVFDVKANLFAVALSRTFAMTPGVLVVPRVSFLTGRVEGPITCNEETANEGDTA